MMRYRVYVTRSIPQPGLDLLRRECGLVDVRSSKDIPTQKELIEGVEGKHALLCLLTDPVGSEVIAAGRDLRIIANYAVGYDNIDVAAATRKGIMVTNTPGVLTDTTADFAFALMMATARRVAEADRYVRAAKWKVPWGLMMMVGQDVWGKTLGIIGLGRIGSAMAQRARGMNMRMIYYDIYRNEQAEKELGVKFVDLETLLKESDFVSVHVPLLPETRHLINERTLKLMKRTACLVNTSRGEVVDEKALYKALTEGWIWGAGLDVWEKEPTDQDNPLLKLDNVTVAPHIASASIATRTKMAVMAAENMVAIQEGKVPPNLVNKEVLGVRPPAK